MRRASRLILCSLGIQQRVEKKLWEVEGKDSVRMERDWTEL